MKTPLPQIFALIFLSVSMPARSGTPEHVDLVRLVTAPDAFLGKNVAFHGCLVSARPHGEFVQPCSNMRHGKIILVSDDTFGNSSPYLVLFKKFKRDSSLRCVQANFTGVLVTTELTWPRTRRQTTIKLTSFNKVSACPA
jgi:hypothetical protein